MANDTLREPVPRAFSLHRPIPRASFRRHALPALNLADSFPGFRRAVRASASSQTIAAILAVSQKMTERTLTLLFNISFAIISFGLCGVALWLWLDLWRDNRELATITAYYIFPVATGLVVVPSIMLCIDFLPDKPSQRLPKS